MSGSSSFMEWLVEQHAETTTPAETPEADQSKSASANFLDWLRTSAGESL